MNITNSHSLTLLQTMGISRMVVSAELNNRGISALRKHSDAELEVIGYGRLPLMLLEHCVMRGTVGCRCDSAAFSLRDRKNEVFPILPLHCGNVIYNSKPIYMADRMTEIEALHIDGIRLCFTFEDYEACRRIIGAYRAALDGKTVSAPNGGFTRGHFYRGMQ